MFACQEVYLSWGDKSVTKLFDSVLPGWQYFFSPVFKLEFMQQASSIKQIRKRNNEIVNFNPEKILKAISMAFVAVKGEVDREVVMKLTQEIVKNVEKNFVDGGIPGIEDVQDVVEQILMENDHFDVAKAYIIYRYEHEKMRGNRKWIKKTARPKLGKLIPSGSQA